jgi:hypothetical protein
MSTNIKYSNIQNTHPFQRLFKNNTLTILTNIHACISEYLIYNLYAFLCESFGCKVHACLCVSSGQSPEIQ